jgi:hypothetical protein
MSDKAIEKRERPKWLNPLTIVGTTLLALDVLLKYGPSVFGESKWPDSGVDATMLAMTVVALLPWISDFLTSAKLPGGIEFAFREVRRRQELTEQAVTQLRFIVEAFLTRGEYNHLLNIRKNKEYKVAPQHVSSLEAELRRLRALRLIEQIDKGVSDFVVSGRTTGAQIGNWFRLTPRGNEYIQMREENAVEQSDTSTSDST